jgi:DHA1 family bicyclomycin/chloramphenicol resistance-like MFS transporter
MYLGTHIRRVACRHFFERQLLKQRKRSGAPGAMIVAYLAAISAIAWMGAVMYTPALPLIAEELQASRASIQFTMTAFMLTFAVAQLAYGPLSDRFGRRGALLTSFVLYIGGSVAVALSPDVTFFTLARVVQAAGGVGALVIARAMVADLFDGDRVRRILAIVNSGASVAPVVALAGGGFTIAVLGWRGIFWLSAGISFAFLILTLLFLKETHTKRDPALYGGHRLIQNLWTLLTTPAFLIYTIAPALIGGTIFGFLTGSPFVLIETLHVSTNTFGFIVALLPVGYIIGALVAISLPSTLGTSPQIIGGASISTAFALILAILALNDSLNVGALTVCMMGFGFGAGLQLPSAMAAALGVRPELAGAASSLLGTIQMGVGGIASFLVGFFETGTGTGMVTVVFLMSFLGLLLAVLGAAVAPRLAASVR